MREGLGEGPEGSLVTIPDYLQLKMRFNGFTTEDLEGIKKDADLGDIRKRLEHDYRPDKDVRDFFAENLLPLAGQQLNSHLVAKKVSNIVLEYFIGQNITISEEAMNSVVSFFIDALIPDKKDITDEAKVFEHTIRG